MRRVNGSLDTKHTSAILTGCQGTSLDVEMTSSLGQSTYMVLLGIM